MRTLRAAPPGRAVWSRWAGPRRFSLPLHRPAPTRKPAMKATICLTVLLSVLATGMGQSMTFALLAPLGRDAGFSEVQIGLTRIDE